MKQLIFVFLLLFCSIASAREPDGKFEELLNKFQENQDQFELALQYADSLQLLADTVDDPLLQVRTFYVKGFIYRNHDRFKEALINYQDGLRLARRNGFRDREAMLLNGLGMTYNLLGRYPEALRNLFLSLEIRKEIDHDKESIAVVLNNIGVVYFNLENYIKAGEYFGESHKLDSSQPFKLVNLGLVALEEKRSGEAYNYFHEFRNQNPDTLNSLFQEYLIGIGLYHKKRENYDSAIHYFNRSVEIGFRRKHDYQLAVSLFNMAAAHYENFSYEKAELFALKSDSLSTQLNAKKLLLKNANLLTKVNIKLGRPEQMVAFFTKFDSLNKIHDATTYGEVNKMEIEEVESGYQQMLQQKEDLLAWQQKANILYLGIAAILGILGLIVYRNKRTKDKMITQLMFAQNQIIEREKLAALGRLMAGIAHELNTPLGGLKGLVRQVGNRITKIVSFSDKPDENGLMGGITAASKMDSYGLEWSSRERRKLRKMWLMLDDPPSSDTIEILTDMGIKSLNDRQLDLLRTPAGERLLKEHYEIQMVSRNLSHMQQAVSRMSTVVGAMQTYTKPGSRQPKHTIVDLRENMEMVLVLLRNNLKRGTNLHLDLPDSPVCIMGDRDRIAQVWTNLIMNSLQAMEFKGEIEVNMLIKEGSACVRIKDDGPGIPEEIRSRVFDAFFTTRRGTTGTGLGLSIVKSIVEEHNGSITLQSEPGETLFEVTFPALNDVT